MLNMWTDFHLELHTHKGDWIWGAGTQFHWEQALQEYVNISFEQAILKLHLFLRCDMLSCSTHCAATVLKMTRFHIMSKVEADLEHAWLVFNSTTVKHFALALTHMYNALIYINMRKSAGEKSFDLHHLRHFYTFFKSTFTSGKFP